MNKNLAITLLTLLFGFQLFGQIHLNQKDGQWGVTDGSAQLIEAHYDTLIQVRINADVKYLGISGIDSADFNYTSPESISYRLVSQANELDGFPGLSKAMFLDALFINPENRDALGGLQNLKDIEIPEEFEFGQAYNLPDRIIYCQTIEVYDHQFKKIKAFNNAKLQLGGYSTYRTDSYYSKSEGADTKYIVTSKQTAQGIEQGYYSLIDGLEVQAGSGELSRIVKAWFAFDMFLNHTDDQWGVIDKNRKTLATIPDVNTKGECIQRMKITYPILGVDISPKKKVSYSVFLKDATPLISDAQMVGWNMRYLEDGSEFIPSIGRVKKDELFYVYDENGKLIINGLPYVRQDAAMGTIILGDGEKKWHADYSGKQLSPVKYDEIDFYCSHNNLTSAKIDNKAFILDSAYNKLYEEVQAIDDIDCYLYEVVKGNQLYIWYVGNNTDTPREIGPIEDWKDLDGEAIGIKKNHQWAIYSEELLKITEFKFDDVSVNYDVDLEDVPFLGKKDGKFAVIYKMPIELDWDTFGNVWQSDAVYDEVKFWSEVYTGFGVTKDKKIAIHPCYPMRGKEIGIDQWGDKFYQQLFKPATDFIYDKITINWNIYDYFEGTVVTEANGKQGLYNTLYLLELLPNNYDEITYSEDWELFLTKNNKKYGAVSKVIYDSDSRNYSFYELKPTYDEIKFKEEWMVVRNGKLWGIHMFGDSLKKLVDCIFTVEPSYDFLYRETKEFADAFVDGKKVKAANTSQGIITFDSYEHLEEDEIFVIKNNGKVGILNDDVNDVILMPVYDSYEFTREAIKVVQNGKTGLIRYGETLCPIAYEDVKTAAITSDGIYAAKQDGKWGVYQFKDNIIPHEYDDVELQWDGVKVLKDGKWTTLSY